MYKSQLQMDPYDYVCAPEQACHDNNFLLCDNRAGEPWRHSVADRLLAWNWFLHKNPIGFLHRLLDYRQK